MKHFPMLFLILALFAHPALAGPQVKYNPEGSPIPTPQMVEGIQYAAEYVWSQYLDVGAEYVGLTGDTLEDGAIVVRWGDLTDHGQLQALLQSEPGEEHHIADLQAVSGTLAYAEWWTRTDTGAFIRAQIVMDIKSAGPTLGTCERETLNHEFGHIFIGNPHHSLFPDDVMFAYRGHCRYSPSVMDLILFNKPIKSCHAELTPDGNLEYLDHKGARVFMRKVGVARWVLDSSLLYNNAVPYACTGAAVINGEVWVEVRTYPNGYDILRLVRDGDAYVSAPYYRVTP